MKRKLTKAEYDALDAALKVIYVADGDGYKMALTDDDDPDALRRARDREKADAKKLREDIAAMKEELDALKTDPARKSGDIKTLEASWQAKVKAAEDAAATRIKALTGTIDGMLIDGAVAKIAGAIAKPETASLLHPHIKNRLEVVYDGDIPTVKVKDATGRISAMNFDELQNEFKANTAFATVIVGSKASGAGGNGGQSNNGGAGGSKNNSGKTFADMSEPERVQLFRDDPAEFTRMSEEHKAASKFEGKRNV